MIKGEVLNFAPYALRRHEEHIFNPGAVSRAQPMTPEGGCTQNKFIQRAVTHNELKCVRYIAKSFDDAKEAVKTGRVHMVRAPLKA